MCIRDSLWYERIPCLNVFGGSSEVFQYTGNKAAVYDRRAQMVRKVAQRMMAAVPLAGCSLVSGIAELMELRGDVVDPIGHYGGTAAYATFLHALSIFAFAARNLVRSRV